MLRRLLPLLAFAFLLSGSAAEGALVRFDTDPFEGSDALTTPGRQVVGGEPFIEFNIGVDRFSFESTVFGVDGVVNFANDLAVNLPTGGVNIVVLQNFDNDGDAGTPFNAGTAANLIAGQITTPGAGFFIYFNQGLDLPRLVFSTDLSDNTADLKILARLVNLTGEDGRNAMPTFSETNFDITEAPEPSSLAMMVLAGVGGLFWRRKISR